MTRGHLDIRRTDAGWHVAIVGGNGEDVMTSEVYTRKQAADDCIMYLHDLLTDSQIAGLDIRTHDLRSPKDGLGTSDSPPPPNSGSAFGNLNVATS